MFHDAPPPTCDHCLASPASWELLEGPEHTVTLRDGREVVRRGRGHVCRGCGHTVPISVEGFHQGAVESKPR